MNKTIAILMIGGVEVNARTTYHHTVNTEAVYHPPCPMFDVTHPGLIQCTNITNMLGLNAQNINNTLLIQQKLIDKLRDNNSSDPKFGYSTNGVDLLRCIQSMLYKDDSDINYCTPKITADVIGENDNGNACVVLYPSAPYCGPGFGYGGNQTMLNLAKAYLTAEGQPTVCITGNQMMKKILRSGKNANWIC
jgi:hypothetical protein